MRILLAACFIALTVTACVCNVVRRPGARKPKVNNSDQHLCSLPPQTGHCKAYMPMWFHNVTSGRCEEFIYGGCGGNDNRFWEPRHCELQCGVVGEPHQCHLKPDPGPCRADVPRWYYDADRAECKVFGWGGCKGNSNNFLNKYICEQRCAVKNGRPTCSPAMCMMACPDGFKKDANGCEICQCSEHKIHTAKPTKGTVNITSAPEVRVAKEKCSDIMCAMFCEHGFKQDTDGCPICECNASPHIRGHTRKEKQPHRCSDVMCMMYCEHGFKKDYNGCPMCSCQESQPAGCPEVQCYRACPHGYKKNHKGCYGCECRDFEHPLESHLRQTATTKAPTVKEIACPYIACTKICPGGYKKDSDGCAMCKCIQKQRVCPNIACHIVCPDGLKTDSDGCPMCDCKASSEQKPQRGCNKEQNIMCIRACPHGVKPDRKNCDKCECAEIAKEHLCPTIDCMMDCPFGRETDQHGCPVCRCIGYDSDWQPAGCRTAQCFYHCPNGYKRDKNGCHTCGCLDMGLEVETTKQSAGEKVTTQKTTPKVTHIMETHTDSEQQPAGCPQIQCYMACPHGYVRDAKGCHECVCLESDTGPEIILHSEGGSDLQPSWCTQIQCYVPCPMGYKMDNKGCHHCECLGPRQREHIPKQGSKPGVTTEQPLPTETSKPHRCSDVMCMMFCEHGFKKNEHGCPICSCQECPEVQCLMACPHGYKKNDKGCYECECREAGEFEHPLEADLRKTPQTNQYDIDSLPSKCRQVRCRRACPNGYKRDADGCHHCECLPPGGQKDKFGHPLERHPVEQPEAIGEEASQATTSPVTKGPQRQISTAGRARQIPKRCTLPPHTGPCKAKKLRWYFNPASGACETFTYGGCRRNKNNFRHKRACLRRCVHFATRRTSRRRTAP